MTTEDYSPRVLLELHGSIPYELAREYFGSEEVFCGWLNTLVQGGRVTALSLMDGISLIVTSRLMEDAREQADSLGFGWDLMLVEIIRLRHT